MAKQHPGFNEHPSVQKGDGHGKSAQGHAGIDRGMSTAKPSAKGAAATKGGKC